MNEYKNDEVTARMEASIAKLISDFSGLRTGRANPSILDTLMVEAYGQQVPIKQVAGVSSLDAQTLSVSVWDTSLVSEIEKAIAGSELGFSTSNDGALIRARVPELNEERRQEIIKIAGKYAENAKVSIRNVRRDGMDEIKRLKKISEIDEDQQKKYNEQLQKITDDFISKIEKELERKTLEITKI